MANANTEITLDALHDAIVARISEHFPALKTVQAYRLDRKALPTPACLIEMLEFETTSEAEDPGTEQLAVTLRFEARLIIGFKTPQAKLEIRKLAAALGVFTRFNRWGQAVGPAKVIGAYPDDFDPELDQYECWRLEWTHVAYLGDSMWLDNGLPVGDPLFSYTPKIGIGNEQYYKPLAETLATDSPIPTGQP